MPFPVASDYDFSAGGAENKKMQEALNHAIMQYESRDSQRDRLRKLYNAHNGIVDEAEIAAITKFTGKSAKTKYVKYRLGRSKMKLLHGEFLMLPLEPQVRTVNQDAMNEKLDKFKTALAMAYTKDRIEQIRQMGFSVMEGMKIPELTDKEYWSLENFKLVNEIIMQVILDKWIKHERIKREFHNNFVDLTVASEIFGKVEKDNNGKTRYRVINPRYAIYEDSVYDPLLERTPYKGEKRMMYYHDIVNSPDFILSEDNKKKLQEISERGSGSDSQTGAKKIGNELGIPVYTLEWKGFEKVVRKISKVNGSRVPYKKIFSKEYYDENEKSILADVKNGLYEIETAYREVIWSSSRIANDIFTTAKVEDDIIQILNANGIYTADYNYCGYLFSTTDGERVSMQELIYELERVYDDIRFQINKELKKPRGNVIIYDEALNPKGKRFIDIYHDLDEHGILRHNTSAEGNEGGVDRDGKIIESAQLGSGEPLRILVEQAMEIEHTVDRITGLNENRQGLTKATMTATANINNIEASRSITFDLFYCITDYMERVLMKILEKEKLGLREDEYIFDETQMRYLKVTRDTMFQNYYPYLSDGRTESIIREKLEQMFNAEINAGNLRSSDVAKFLRESSFAKALKVLDQASKELAELRMQEIQAAQEAKNNEIEAGVQIAQEDREDRQEHDKEMEVLKTEGKKEIVVLQEALKGAAKEPV